MIYQDLKPILFFLLIFFLFPSLLFIQSAYPMEKDKAKNTAKSAIKNNTPGLAQPELPIKPGKPFLDSLGNELETDKEILKKELEFNTRVSHEVPYEDVDENPIFYDTYLDAREGCISCCPIVGYYPVIYYNNDNQKYLIYIEPTEKKATKEYEKNRYLINNTSNNESIETYHSDDEANIPSNELREIYYKNTTFYDTYLDAQEGCIGYDPIVLYDNNKQKYFIYIDPTEGKAAREKKREENRWIINNTSKSPPNPNSSSNIDTETRTSLENDILETQQVMGKILGEKKRQQAQLEALQDDWHETVVAEGRIDKEKPAPNYQSMDSYLLTGGFDEFFKDCGLEIGDIIPRLYRYLNKNTSIDDLANLDLKDLFYLKKTIWQIKDFYHRSKEFKHETRTISETKGYDKINRTPLQVISDTTKKISGSKWKRPHKTTIMNVFDNNERKIDLAIDLKENALSIDNPQKQELAIKNTHILHKFKNEFQDRNRKTSNIDLNNFDSLEECEKKIKDDYLLRKNVVNKIEKNDGKGCLDAALKWKKNILIAKEAAKQQKAYEATQDSLFNRTAGLRSIQKDEGIFVKETLKRGEEKRKEYSELLKTNQSQKQKAEQFYNQQYIQKEPKQQAENAKETGDKARLSKIEQDPNKPTRRNVGTSELAEPIVTYNPTRKGEGKVILRSSTSGTRPPKVIRDRSATIHNKPDVIASNSKDNYKNAPQTSPSKQSPNKQIPQKQKPLITRFAKESKKIAFNAGIQGIATGFDSALSAGFNIATQKILEGAPSAEERYFPKIHSEEKIKRHAQEIAQSYNSETNSDNTTTTNIKSDHLQNDTKPPQNFNVDSRNNHSKSIKSIYGKTKNITFELLKNVDEFGIASENIKNTIYGLDETLTQSLNTIQTINDMPKTTINEFDYSEILRTFGEHGRKGIQTVIDSKQILIEHIQHLLEPATNSSSKYIRILASSLNDILAIQKRLDIADKKIVSNVAHHVLYDIVLDFPGFANNMLEGLKVISSCAGKLMILDGQMRFATSEFPVFGPMAKPNFKDFATLPLDQMDPQTRQVAINLDAIDMFSKVIVQSIKDGAQFTVEHPFQTYENLGTFAGELGVDGMVIGGIGKVFGKAAERAGRVMRNLERTKQARMASKTSSFAAAEDLSSAAKFTRTNTKPNFGKVKGKGNCVLESTRPTPPQYNKAPESKFMPSMTEDVSGVAYNAKTEAEFAEQATEYIPNAGRAPPTMANTSRKLSTLEKETNDVIEAFQTFFKKEANMNHDDFRKAREALQRSFKKTVPSSGEAAVFQREAKLANGYSIKFRRDIGEKAHAIPDKGYANPIDHYNIELFKSLTPNKKPKCHARYHVIIDNEGNVFDDFGRFLLKTDKIR